MDIRQAILKAADSIEQEGSYKFMSQKVASCGSPMCMWGWIGFHLGMPEGTSIDDVPAAIGCQDDDDLYQHEPEEFRGFTSDPKVASAKMRSFANAKFPA